MSRVEIYDSGIRHLFASPTGSVAKIVREKASAIERNARTNMQTKLDSRSGDLEAALRQIPIPDPDGYRVVVGSDATHRGFPYARALETGVNPLTGEPMNFHKGTSFMVPAVEQAGFRRRSI